MLRREATAPAGATRSFGDILRDVKNNLPDSFRIQGLDDMQETDLNTVTDEGISLVKSELEDLVAALPGLYSGSELSLLEAKIGREINSIDIALRQAETLRRLTTTQAANHVTQEAADSAEITNAKEDDSDEEPYYCASTEPYDDFSSYIEEDDHPRLSGNSDAPTDE